LKVNLAKKPKPCGKKANGGTFIFHGIERGWPPFFGTFIKNENIPGSSTRDILKNQIR
jgi:hypothetical protein